MSFFYTQKKKKNILPLQSNALTVSNYGAYKESAWKHREGKAGR